MIAASALWAQLVLIPMVATGAPRGVDPVSAIVGLVSLSIPIVAWQLGARRQRAAIAGMLAGFPAALGVYSVVAARQGATHFDVAAGLIAVTTAVVFMATALAWVGSMARVFPVTLAALAKRSDTVTALPLRHAVFGLLSAMAVFLAVVAPAVITAHAPASRAERVGGEAMLRAREAVTFAGGLAIALALVLGAGPSVMRQRGVRQRRATRGVAFLLWGVAVLGLDWLIRVQR